MVARATNEISRGQHGRVCAVLLRRIYAGPAAWFASGSLRWRRNAGLLQWSLRTGCPRRGAFGMTVPRDRTEARRFLLATVAFLISAPISVALAALHLVFAAAFVLPAALASVYLYSLASREVREPETPKGTITSSLRASVVQQQLLGEEPFRLALSMIGWRTEPWIWIRRCALATLAIAAAVLFAVLALRV